MTIAADLHRLKEDERIKMIGASVMVPKADGAPVMNAFVVEDDRKADRYIRKLQKLFPSIRIIDRRPGPVANTIMVRIGGPLH